MDFYPAEDAALKELIDALERWTVDDAHAVRVVEEILDDSSTRKCPTPGVIRNVAYSTRPEPPRVKPTPPKCARCEDSGLVDDGIATQDAVRCECAAGVNLADAVLAETNRAKARLRRIAEPGNPDPTPTKQPVSDNLPRITAADFAPFLRERGR